MPARISQSGLIAVSEPLEQPARISQLALLSVQGPSVSAIKTSQMATIAVVANGQKSISLGNPIMLNCWQPCTAYGTTALIYYIGAN